MVLLRSESEIPPIHDSDSEEEYTDPARPGHPSSRPLHTLADSESSSERLTVADHVDDDPVTSFISETDFDSATLYLETRRIQACFRLQLCTVSWAPDDIHTDYVRKLRPYDEYCSTDAWVFESRLIRVPDALDKDSVNSYGSSTSGSGRCGGPGADGAAGGREEQSAPGTTAQSPNGGGE